MDQILLLILVSSLQFTQSEAANSAAEAYYKQSGAERVLTEWTEKNTTRELRATVGHITFVTQTLVTKHIMIKWDF